MSPEQETPKDNKAKKKYRHKKTPERMLLKRNLHRDKRHPGWRHIIDYYNGVCARCGEPMEELHDPFGEDHNGEGKMQIRIPLCSVCHVREHPCWQNRNRHTSESKYLDDISAEIVSCGGYAEWVRHYHIPGTVPQMQVSMKLNGGGES